MGSGSTPITQLLNAWAGGDQAALDSLMPLVYDELRRTARRYMRRERAGNTLQTTALVNEVYLRLIGAGNVTWKNRVHFFAVSAQIMRRILVDAARKKAAAKRGGLMQKPEHSAKIDFNQIADLSHERSRDLIAMDDALNALSEFDTRKARVIELRFFAGLNVEEAAEVLGVSSKTVLRDWELAKAWLRREMERGGSTGASSKAVAKTPGA